MKGDENKGEEEEAEEEDENIVKEVVIGANTLE